MGFYVEMVRPGDPYGPRAARRDVPYRAYVPEFIVDLEYQPQGAAAEALIAAAEQASRLDARAEGSQARISRLMGLLCRSEGVGSSTIEGYRTSMAKIVTAEATGESPHSPTTATIIRDGIRAVEETLASLGDPATALTPAAIEQVQRNLMRNQRTALQGYRTGPVQVGGDATDPNTADFVPPPADRVSDLMDDLCAFMARTDEALHPIVRAAIAHAQFETIHPFPDGNGRVGRSLIQAMLRREGVTATAILPVSLAIADSDESRRAYVRALDALRGDETGAADLDLVVATFADFVSHAAGRAMKLIDAADRVYDELVATVNANTRANAAARGLVDVVAAHVGVTVAAAAADAGVTEQTARNGLERMCELGLVEHRSGGRFGKVYFSPALIALLEDASGAPVVDTADMAGTAATTAAVGAGRGRPRKGPRCGKPLRTGGTCMRSESHTGGCRGRP